MSKNTRELAQQHVSTIEKQMEKKYCQNKWAATVGILECQLGSIFSTLNTYYPDAYKEILNNLGITQP